MRTKNKPLVLAISPFLKIFLLLASLIANSSSFSLQLYSLFPI